MVSFWNGIVMCLPFYTKCKTCKYFHSISPKRAKCRHFINLNVAFILEKPNEFYCEDDLYLDVEVARLDRGLCGRNGSYYERRIK